MSNSLQVLNNFFPLKGVPVLDGLCTGLMQPAAFLHSLNRPVLHRSMRKKNFLVNVTVSPACGRKTKFKPPRILVEINAIGPIIRLQFQGPIQAQAWHCKGIGLMGSLAIAICNPVIECWFYLPNHFYCNLAALAKMATLPTNYGGIPPQFAQCFRPGSLHFNDKFSISNWANAHPGG